MMTRLYENIARWCLYLLVLLVPLTYLPWTVDGLEINKQTLTLVLVFVAVIAWLGLMVSAKQFFLKKSWLFLAAGAFLISALVSSALSIAPVTSWIGQSTQEYTSFITLLAFGLMFVLGAHFLDETKSQRAVWMLAFVASAIVGIFAVCAAIGMPILNTLFIGTPHALGLYLSTLSILGCGLWLVSNGKSAAPVLPKGALGVVTRALIGITALSTVVVLTSIDYLWLWLPLIVGLVVLFTFALYRANEFPHTSYFVLPMLLFVVSILLVFLPTPFRNQFPIEIAPSAKVSGPVAFKSLGDTSVFFGSGPGTFVMDYAKYKDPSVNETAMWDTRFDRANTQFFTMLATFGVVGTTSFFFLVAAILFMTLSALVKRQPSDEWKMTFVAFTGWVVLVVGLFTYSSNFTLSFLFWFLSAVLVSQMGPPIKHIPFTQSPRGALLTTFLFVLVSVILLTLLLVSVSRYAAEVTFARAIHADREDAELDEIIAGLDDAAQLNKWNDLYYRNLSSALLFKVAELLANGATDTAQLQQYVGVTIGSALRAKAISPNYVVNWSLLGDIYFELAPIVGGADQLAVAAYGESIALAPTNPKYYTAQARAYVAQADALSALLESEDEMAAGEAAEKRDDALSLAEVQLLTATELKPDYAPAHYYLALVYERQGNLGEAISRLKTLSETSPLDVGIHFELGLLYLKQGKVDLAQTSFERAIEIAPNFSNAHWYLSYVYEQQGDIDTAIAQVEMIAELNPENTLVEQRLAELQAGKETVELPVPLEEGEEQITEVP